MTNFSIVILIMFLSISAYSKNLVLESGENQVHLVELYSSEGCSSCPPADKWLAKLKKNKGLWKNFVPVEFHVDYWNYLGWIDPHSNQRFSQRQRNYSSEWFVRRVYTPGFVLNGEEWRANASQLQPSKKKVGNLKVSQKKKNSYLVEFKPKSKTKKKYRVFASLLGNGLETKVPAGENAGETLKHEFVVLELEEKALKKKGGTYSAEIVLKPKFKAKPKSLSVAFWVSEKDLLKPIQAVGGDLK